MIGLGYIEREGYFLRKKIHDVMGMIWDWKRGMGWRWRLLYCMLLAVQDLLEGNY